MLSFHSSSTPQTPAQRKEWQLLHSELSSSLCCSKALPSTAILQFCCSAHQWHTSNNVSHTRHELLKSDLTQQHSISRSKCLDWWHNYNIWQQSRRATLGETWFTRRKILQRKLEYSKLCCG